MAKDTPDVVAVVFSPCKTYRFDDNGGSYSPQTCGGNDGISLSWDSGECQFEFIDCDKKTYFFDWSGKWLRTEEPGGSETTSEVDDLDQITKMSRQVEIDGKTVTASLDFDYQSNGLMSSMTYATSGSPSAGHWRVVYTYYEAGDYGGNAGALKTSTYQLLKGTTWVDHETTFMRYYTEDGGTGVEDGLK
ncbi:MAG: hypothetical protein GY708_11655, partial [Actinomycetia bacterium]|nr:hypothetical protein [Actinomycetes bacterium]